MVRNATGRFVAFWLPKVKSLGRRSPFLSFFPLPLPPVVLRLPLSPSCVSGEEEGCAWCCGVVDLAWSEEEVAVRREGPLWVRFLVTGKDFLCPSRSGWIGSPSGFIDSFTTFPILPSPLCCVWMICGRPGIEDPVGLPPCWCRDGSACPDIRGGVGLLERDLIATRLAVAIRLSHRTSRSRQDYCRGMFLPGRNRAVAVPFPVAMPEVRRGFVVLPRLFARCVALEGLSRSEVVSVSWDPHPQEPVEGVLQAMSVLELAAHVWDAEGFGVLSQRRPDSPLSHYLSLCWFRSHVVVLGVRPQLGQAAVLFHIGTSVYGFPTLRCTWGPGWFCLWALDPVELKLQLQFPKSMAMVEGVDVWWASVLRTRYKDGAIEVTWAEFTKLFWAKFIPEHIQDKMEQEFLSLTQGSMTAPFFLYLLQLLLCRVHGECGLSACLCRSGVVGAGDAELSSEVLLEFFSVGSGVSEVSPGLFPEPFAVVLNGALVVLLEVLPGPACVASAVLLAAVFSLMLGCILVRFSQDGSWRFWWRFSPELLRVISVVSAWALPVKASYAWPCIWLLRWPACLVIRFQVFSAVLADFVYPRGPGGLLCSCTRCALADSGLVSVVVLDWLCFVWKCQSRVVVLPLACGRDSCVSPSSTFRRLLEVVVLYYGVVLPGCASLRPSGGVTFPGVVFGSSCLGRRGVRSGFLAQTRQSLVSLPLSVLVPEPRSGVRREAPAWPGCGGVCVVRFCGGSVSPFAGVEAGARLASRACGLWVPLLAASGGGLVAIVVTTFPHDVSKCSPVALAGTVVIVWPCLVFRRLRWSGHGQTHAFGGSHSASSRYCSSVLGCQSVVAPACMASRPCGVPGVWGGSACGPSTLWRSEVAVLAAHPPYFLQLGARRYGSSVSDGLRRRLWHLLLSAVVRASVICSFLSTPLLSLELDLDSHVLYVEKLVCNFWRLSKALEKPLFTAKNLFWELYGLA
ncbi:hypothetical protein Taro_016085 [Colocasia esculenta]|uniref:Retrotransposon gag domain-containing protein n=1 Tax=Colocasia esculenta TaxID=4460 RepID=A0A843UP88_COLES|nr:hypothetical protein [Colocasia esculenta]